MKKTFTINISGSIFHIDEDAYEKLQRYLHMLNRHFSAAVEGQEILQDIEARISELLIEKTANKTEVITNEIVDEVISRMGKPEDFIEAEEEPTSKAQAESKTPESEPIYKRRLYRDGDNRIIGGVCSGMGAFFNIDPVILRIIFVLLFFLGVGSSFLIYIIMWIVVPKASTTAQRLEMKGKEPTVSNIEKSIKEEVNEVGQNYQKFMNSKDENGQNRVDRFGDVVNSSFRVVLRVLLLVLGVILLVAGIASLIGFVTSMAVGHTVLHNGVWSWHSNVDITSLLSNFVNPEAYNILMVTLSILAGIPILLILFAGTKLIFRYKTNNKLIGLGAFGIWLLALVITIVVGVNQVGNFSRQTSQTVSQKMDNQQSKTIYLEASDDLYESLIENDISLDRMKIAVVNGKQRMLGHPRFTIEKGSSDEVTLLVKKYARGATVEDAQKNITEIEYNIVQKDSTIQFDPYYFLKEDARWREQEVSMTLKVPVGKAIFLSRGMEDIIDDIENTENMWDNDMVGKTWIMTPDGLTLKKETVPAQK